jgi:hypothetical protein
MRIMTCVLLLLSTAACFMKSTIDLTLGDPNEGGRGGGGGAAGVGGGPETASTGPTATTSSTGAGSATATACPEQASDECQQIYGTKLSGVLCFTDASSPPPACLLFQAGVTPAVFCCPPPGQTGGDGGPDNTVGIPTCVSAVCPIDAPNPCPTWFVDGDKSVHRCVGPQTPNSGPGDAFLCVPPAAWGMCGAYDDATLCCAM